MDNKSFKGKADTSGSSWVNSGRFQSSPEQNKGSGSFKDTERPGSAAYSGNKQIGPVSKTGFGQDKD